MNQPDKYPTYEAWLADEGDVDPTKVASIIANDAARFPLQSVERREGIWPDRAYYDYRVKDASLGYRDHDIYTAEVWTLHLRIDSPVTGDDYADVPLGAVALLNTLISLTGCEALTGHYCGGDSFHQWAEVYENEEDDPGHMGRALHVYFEAPNLDRARAVAQGICTALSGVYLDPHWVCLSTAGDWAEQAEVWLTSALNDR
ncbi:MAG: hypothetical protein ABIQ39_02635 [Ilumatobacteraceae bacterium]